MKRHAPLAIQLLAERAVHLIERGLFFLVLQRHVVQGLAIHPIGGGGVDGGVFHRHQKNGGGGWSLCRLHFLAVLIVGVTGGSRDTCVDRHWNLGWVRRWLLRINHRHVRGWVVIVGRVGIIGNVGRVIVVAGVIVAASEKIGRGIAA